MRRTFGERPAGLTRRRLLVSAGAATAGAGVAGAAYRLGGDANAGATAPSSDERISLRGDHQPGIVTRPQLHLQLAAFDFAGADAGELSELMRSWTELADQLMAARRPARGSISPHEPPSDTGEADDSPAAALSVTFGFGATLFERDGDDRLGLGRSMPAALRPLPAFDGEGLDASRSGGDLGVQICGDDPQVVFHALHMLGRAASGVATPRWTQSGFGGNGGRRGEPTPRNLMGFRDGTNNIALGDAGRLDTQVWVSARDGAAWMVGGTYLVARRIRILLDVWDETSLSEQERAVGRHKASGAPLGARSERDRVDLGAEGPNGPAIPANAHVRLAAPESNGGARLLRRSYSFSDGVDQGTGQLDAGLVFIAFQRDPHRQFVPIQQRLSQNDALNRHLLHTASAVFACPRGARRGGYVGETLFAS